LSVEFVFENKEDFDNSFFLKINIVFKKLLMSKNKNIEFFWFLKK